MPLVLHIPHDSTVIPEKYVNDFLLSENELSQEIISMTDMHTNDLYEHDDVEKIIFPISRLVCDPERFDDDSQEIMAERGMGVLYEITSQLKPLRSKLDKSKRHEILNSYYYPHHQKLTNAVENKLQDEGKCLIIDCHSFPSRALPYELSDKDDLRAEICIGTDSFHTPENIKKQLFEFFKNKGYSVSIDDPFAGALVPMKYYRVDKNVKSVMYEIRRDLYMNETTGEKNHNFSNIQKDITESMKLLESLVI